MNEKQVVYVKESGNGTTKTFLVVLLLLVIGYMFYTTSGTGLVITTESPSGVPVVVTKQQAVISTVEHDMVATAKAIVVPLESSPPSINDNSVIVVTAAPQLQVLTDGGLPLTGPYSLQDIEKCREYQSNGVDLKSPQSELCAMYLR